MVLRGVVWVLLCGIAWYCMGTVWCCMVLCGIALYPVVLHGIAWYPVVLHGTLWYCMVPCGIAWYYCGIAWYSVVLHGITRYSVVLHVIVTIVLYIGITGSFGTGCITGTSNKSIIIIITMVTSIYYY